MKTRFYSLTILSAAIIALVGCSDDTPTSTNTDFDSIDALYRYGGVVHLDGTNFQYYPGLERTPGLVDGDPENWLGGQNKDSFDPNQCQHWTFDQGRWWVRNCGYTLAQQCMYFSGPTGELHSCDEVGGGPGGNW
jgi:hypothetical protein